MCISNADHSKNGARPLASSGSDRGALVGLGQRIEGFNVGDTGCDIGDGICVVNVVAYTAFEGRARVRV